jgi:hypothetical protein
MNASWWAIEKLEIMGKDNKNNIILIDAKIDFIMQNLNKVTNKMNNIEAKIYQFENTNKLNIVGTRKAATELINNMLIDFKKQFESNWNDIKERQMGTSVYKEEVIGNVMNLNARVTDLQRENPNKKNNQSSSDDEHHKKTQAVLTQMMKTEKLILMKYVYKKY